jgi:hypothetical protein
MAYIVPSTLIKGMYMVGMYRNYQDGRLASCLVAAANVPPEGPPIIDAKKD